MNLDQLKYTKIQRIMHSSNSNVKSLSHFIVLSRDLVQALDHDCYLLDFCIKGLNLRFDSTKEIM